MASMTMSLAEAKVQAWARAQAEDHEIEGSLIIACGWSPSKAFAYVRDNESMLQHLRWDGRRIAREQMHEVMLDVDGGCKLNGSQITLLGMFLKAHCGYAKEGVDDKIRDIIRKAEREKAKGGKPSLVPPPKPSVAGG